jgi:hypothetical protein
VEGILRPEGGATTKKKRVRIDSTVDMNMHRGCLSFTYGKRKVVGSDLSAETRYKNVILKTGLGFKEH